VSIKIVDDDGNEVAAGVVGKIYARHFATSLFTYINREVDRKAVENDGYVTVKGTSTSATGERIWCCQAA
jgi:non-ribosomal peptide synthetase component E (peptide arylation enzyme)